MLSADVVAQRQARVIRLGRILFCAAVLFVAMLVAMHAFGRESSWSVWAVALLNAGNAGLAIVRLPPRVSLALSMLSVGVAIVLTIALFVRVAR